MKYRERSATDRVTQEASGSLSFQGPGCHQRDQFFVRLLLVDFNVRLRRVLVVVLADWLMTRAHDGRRKIDSLRKTEDRGGQHSFSLTQLGLHEIALEL